MTELAKIVAIIGPTASGKTDWGLFLAQKFAGEIVSADAKQVYRGMDIGTAKEVELPVKQHLLDIREPGQKMSVGQYQLLAYEVIDQLLAKKVLPILVGGSGLYAESVLNGYIFSSPEKSSQQEPRYQALKIGIQLDREVLKERVAQRVQAWWDGGLLEEISALRAQGVSDEWLSACGLEYRYFLYYLQGQLSKEEALEKTRIANNQFIKRQYTWWRRHSDIHWLDSRQKAAEVVSEFLG